MDDELPSWGKEKVNKRSKKMLMLCLGLFFSIYFREKSLIVASANRLLENNLKQQEKPIILSKTTFFKFDPMEQLANSIEKNTQIKKKSTLENREMTEKKEDKIRNIHEQKYQDLIADSPLKEMLPFIVKCDNETAAFLIAIAKKESDFGKHSPQKAGRDCFNYWGYRGEYNQTASGYSCFDSPEQAIAVVGKRINELIAKKINTAEKMVVWKCGASCAGHNPVDVKKWITDVALYYGKANS